MNENNSLSVADSGCGWWQGQNAAGQCEFSGMAVVQTVFGLPSRVVERQLVALPGPVVPLAALAVNIGFWWMMYKLLMDKRKVED